MSTVPVAADRSTKSAATAVSPLPIDAVQVTVTVFSLAADSTSVGARVLGSRPSCPEVLVIPTTGASSSSLMVPVAVGSDASCTRLAGDGSDSVTVKVWSGSSVVSSFTGTVNFAVMAFASNSTSPVFVVARSAALAVSPLSIDAVQVNRHRRRGRRRQRHRELHAVVLVPLGVRDAQPRQGPRPRSCPWPWTACPASRSAGSRSSA